MSNAKPNIPKKDHPWRKGLSTSEVNRWNKEKSDQTRVNSFRIGQLNKGRR